MGPVVKPIAGTVLALMAMLASFGAAALGLGQIDVRSRLGQPLLAEIPIVTGDPSELEQLQAGLASPDTFARIGLRPPIGLVADLQFMQALDARGNPVIRVTSTQPVNEPLLTFLVEVDWGQGRLVREYSALIDTPRTVSAPLQPEIAAPTVEAPALIERPADEGEPGAAEVVATGARPAPDAEAGVPADAEAMPREAIAPRPVAAPSRSAPPTPRPVFAGGRYEVRRGDTLSEIAARTRAGATLDQTMIALLRANPDAFIDGNINRLKAGAVLRMPSRDALTELDARQARAIVRTQIQEWRASRRAVTQPVDDTGEGGSVSNPASARSTAASTAPAGARLEIVPPGASDATKAGTQSGISAGGRGSMLQQDLIQTRETLAAREAEAQELKSRVAELEKLQQQQQQLIAMKDSELAAAQQRLAQAQKTQGQASMTPWVTGLAVVLVLAVILFAWLLRRRDAAVPKFRAPSVADAFAPERTAEAAEADRAAAMPEHAPGPPAGMAPAWHTGPAATQPDLLDAATQAAHERLELARSYLHLGDLASARQLLGEVVINGDHTARQQAARMLRELE